MSWVIDSTVTTKGGNDCIPILISNYNFPTTRSNRDETIYQSHCQTTQPIYDSQQDTRQECDWLGLSKSGSVTMNTRNNQGFARSPKHRRLEVDHINSRWETFETSTVEPQDFITLSL
jgi:hypothetical protein